MHIVHYNKIYGSLGAALDKEDGLAVLAFFFIVRIIIKSILNKSENATPDLFAIYIQNYADEEYK